MLDALEEFPSFFLLVLEAVFLLRAGSPEFSATSRLVQLHAELLSHRGLVLASCFDEEAQRLVQDGCGLLGPRGRSWLRSAEQSCDVDEALVSCHGKEAACDHGAAQGGGIARH